MQPATEASPFLSLSAAAPKKGRSTTPEVTDHALADSIERFISAKQAAESAAALAETEAAQITAAAAEHRLAACRARGKVESSVRLNGRLLYTQQSKYCQIPYDQADRLAEAFGAESAGRYFRTAYKVTLRPEAAADMETHRELLRLIGVERFGRLFEVKAALEPTESFHAAVTLDAATAAQAAPLVEDGTIRAYAAALKIV